MTVTESFDRTVAAWLVSDGPTEMRTSAIDDALASARHVAQRRGLRAVVAGPGAWPVAGRRVRIPRVTVRLVVVVALVLMLIAAAAALLVGSYPLQGPAVPRGLIAYAVTSSDSDSGEVRVIRPDGTGSRLLNPDGTPGRCPRFSPDGSRIAYFATADGRDDLVVVGPDGSDRRTSPLLTQRSSRTITWSPDGRQVAYDARIPGSPGGGTFELAIENVDGSDARVVVPQTEYGGRPSWSPDGTWIAFLGETDGDGAIFLVHPDGTQRHQLVAAPGVNS